MFLIECVNAYAATVYLAEKEWDYKTAYALAELKRALQPHVDFFIKEEQKLIQEYGRKGEDGTVELTEKGTFRFAAAEDAQKYNAKRNELGLVPVKTEWEVRKLPRPERIKPIHLEALRGFIDFGGGD